MNTPSHAILNLALLEPHAPRTARWPILLGGILPDLPIFAFYVYEKAILGIPEAQIWSVDYFASAWQAVIDGLHSFPLILLALVVAWRMERPAATAFAMSLLLHALCDFPLHHDDAHRQLFPFSDFRFRSPISYWDPRHHGALGSAIEVIAVVAASAALGRKRTSHAARLGFALVAGLYLAAWIAFYGVGVLTGGH